MMNLSMCAQMIIVLDAFIHAEDDQYDCFSYLKQLLFQLQTTYFRFLVIDLLI
jgi:hypothetical protein